MGLLMSLLIDVLTWTISEWRWIMRRNRKDFPKVVNRLESDLAESEDSPRGESINVPTIPAALIKTFRYAVERGLTFEQIMFVVNTVVELLDKLGKEELICRMETVLTVIQGDVEYLKRHPEHIVSGRPKKK